MAHLLKVLYQLLHRNALVGEAGLQHQAQVHPGDDVELSGGDVFRQSIGNTPAEYIGDGDDLVLRVILGKYLIDHPHHRFPGIAHGHADGAEPMEGLLACDQSGAFQDRL